MTAIKKKVNTVSFSKSDLEDIGKVPGFEKVGTQLKRGTTIKKYK